MKRVNKFVIFRMAALLIIISACQPNQQAWIRINQLGYLPNGVKVAVWCSKQNAMLKDFQLINVRTNQIVHQGIANKVFGAYGPFTQTYRLLFSGFQKAGRYYVIAGGIKSPEFTIGDEVYQGTADFCLRYLRQQRSGFNPFLQDSCHTRDGYTLYGPMPDSTRINVVGGWHDASDYLQYATTSANATYHLRLVYRDFDPVFTNCHLNGYSTNEPTMDGTASLVYLLAAMENEAGRVDDKIKK